MTLTSTIGFFLCLTIPMLGYCQSTVEDKEPLSTKAISALVPKKIENYSLKGDPKSSTLSVGRLTYSLCQRDFVSHKKHLQFLLFDYNNAEIMFNQTMRKWSEMKTVDTDSIYFQKTQSADRSLFESYFPHTNHSQIVMGINNRFFLTITGDKVELEELRALVKLIDLEKFPK